MRGNVQALFGGEGLAFLDNQDPASYPTGVLFNEEQECPEGPHLRNGVRGERPALDRGTIRGGKRAEGYPCDPC